MNYLLVTAATLLLAFDFSLSKKYQSLEGSDPLAGLKFNLFIGLFTAIIFFVISGFKLQFSPFSVILAFALSLFGMLYSVIGFRILKNGNVALYSIFLMSGGMLMPYLFGIAFWDETPTILRIIGVIIILIAVMLFDFKRSSATKTQILLCIAVFLLNGFVSIISKYHQINTTYEMVDSAVFVMYSGMAKCILSSILLLFNKGNHTEIKHKFCFKKSLAFYITVFSALISGVSYLLQLIGAKNLPATVLYPLVTGGNIIFSSIAGKVFFKEKLNRLQLISIALCFIGTLLFL
ncbi:MAG: hypothetical protein E7551_04770 [Ruminococcaceae bacterium]|nr:hypothetical protein [Oscillospiraceae bacterium]